MPDYASSIVHLIDNRVDQSQQRVTHFGTVTGRSTGSLDPDGAAWATVVLDGSAGSTVAVKCFANVIVAPGDRVGLVKFGRDWIIVGNYTGRGLADALLHFPFSGSTTNTSTTFADLPGSPTIAFTKMRDITELRLAAGISTSVTGSTPAIMRLALRIRSADGVTDFDQDIGFFRFDAIARFHWRTVFPLTGQPAGDYTAVGRWRRSSGAGTLQIDSADLVDFEVREVWP